jgi:hypothetical protein
VVGQQGRVLHSATPVGVGEGGANGGGDRGRVRRSVSRQDQLVDGVENASCAVSHHRLDMPGVAVDGNRVVHGRRCGPVGCQEPREGPSRGGGRRGQGRRSEPRSSSVSVGGGRGSGLLVVVVDKSEVGEACCARQLGRACRKRGRQGHVWCKRGGM